MTFRLLIPALAGSSVFSGCGYMCDRLSPLCGVEKEEQGPVAEFEMTGAQASGAYSFDDTTTCDYDPDKGLLRVSYVEAEKSLQLEVRDFHKAPASYDCRQAADNSVDVKTVGSIYESCLVEAKTPSASGVGSDSYAMARGSPYVKRFTYGGGCRIDAEAPDDELTGSFICADMAQIALANLPRNPVATDQIHPDATASFQGAFRCNLRTTSLAGGPVLPPPPKPSATLAVKASDGTTPTVAFAGGAFCTLDPDSGLFKASFTDSGGALQVEIRDFADAGGAYSCRQAANNATDPADAGDLYESCMVSLSAKRSQAAATQDGYAMHRSSAAIKPFAYADSCIVDVKKDLADLKATIDCRKMAQTVYGGLPRNPVATDDVHADVSADVTGEFTCRLQRLNGGTP